jgi:DNA-binding LytR/AlgR family response regulator
MMHTEIKIGIVEDELLIAEKIKRILENMGYETCEPSGNYEEALNMIKMEKPDLLLLDINLNDKKDGIDLAVKINELYQIPFIFLTANSDSKTIERAKKVKPHAFLVKPFNKDELFASIEIAFNNYSSTKIAQANPIITGSTPNKDFIFIRDSHRFIKILFTEIVSIESQENYVVIHTKDKKNSMFRSTFSDFLAQLPESNFIRIHRSFAVQLSLIEHVEPTEITAAGQKIPLSNSYREELYAVLGIK